MTEQLNKPLVTVLMAVYNGEKYLKEAIASILTQTFTDFEFLIVNDGSTDNSAEIIKSFNDCRLKVITNSKNIGVIKTLNKAMQHIRGEYVARMDSDDICLPERLEKETAILKNNPYISVVAANVALMDTEGKNIGFWSEDINAKSPEEIYRQLPYDNCIANPTVMLRTSLLLKYKYNTFQKSSEDWDLWLNMASDSEQFYKINEVLVKYRMHSSSITAGFNRRSVYRKKNSVQVRYFISRVMKGRVHKFEWKVLKNGILNYFKFILNAVHPSILSIWMRMRRENMLKVLKQFYELFLFCRSKTNTTSIFFFFPFFHIGGAEKIHARIMEAVADQKPVCFITGISSDDGFLKKFNEEAILIDISLLTNYPYISRISKKLISKYIGKANGAITFSCNSKFYYDLVPYFNSKVKCIDLIHAFVHKGEEGAEYWSLPVAERMDRRIVITKKTMQDFKWLYKENGMNDSFLNRVEYISNCTNVPPIIDKRHEKKLKILFAGRNGMEKRVYLIGKIAAEIFKVENNIEFELVGVTSDAVQANNRDYCIFKGIISDELEMQKIYDASDILLLTSTREGFPMVIMEAMANGLVVITTDVGGIRDHIVNYENGLLISSQNEDEIVKDFVKAIMELNSKRELLKEISDRAHEYAKINFSEERFLKSYRNLLLPDEINNA